MDLPFSSTFSPFSPQYETPTTTTFAQFPPQQDDDVIIPSLVPQHEQHLDNNNNILLKIPSFSQNEDLHQLLGNHETSRLRRTSSSLDDRKNEDTNHNDPKKKKKMVHREIERQRRSEMSSLHASLRSLLPHDYIRGKRAMSDHLGEAVKYIRDLEQNIKALKEQRDSLKNGVSLEKSSKSRDREVKVKSNKGGVEVNVRLNSYEVEGNDEDASSNGFRLSKVLQCLIEEGFEVVSCISQRLDHSTLLHCIQAQVCTPLITIYSCHVSIICLPLF
ncbi:hypothetical protein RND81_08G121100 [Saponaria officinalis]|uniref:BHLH domain-containing protein n=1 Tax=Saponaria officinalis TaxID=3572 RepID=A0AAW1J737_SAPOF